MSDDLFGKTVVFDFDEFANHLIEQGLQSSPAEIHGCLTGLLASGAAVEAELALVALADVLDLTVHGELAGQTMELYTVTASALQDDEFDFHPLLPDDETAISERSTSLAGWCSGFIGGFALGTAAAPDTRSGRAKDIKEILEDIEAFSQVAVDEDFDEEEAEESFFDIVEYLRFAVLNVHLDSQSAQESV